MKTITAVATDTSNKPTTATAQITLDTTAPLVAITSPADGTSGTSPTLAVSGTVSDALSGVAGVTCNGVAAAVSGGTYTCSVSLVPGSNPVTATATDVAGNTAAATIHATYTPDTQAPVITITSPAAGTFTRNATVTVSGTASDDVAVASVTVNGATVPLNSGAWTTTVTLTNGDGAKTISATAIDGTGKTTTATVQISLDTTPPVVAITSPATGSSGTSSTVTVTGSVTDALSGVAGVKCNGAAAVTSSGTFTCSVTLVPGDNPIDAVATDVAGNTATATIHATYTPDLLAPVITITTPVAGTFTRNPTITVSGTASDDVAVAKVTVENVEVPFANGAWTTTVTLTGADGPRTLTAVAIDGTGKTTPAQVQIALDTTAPAVTITAPPNHSSGTNSSITVSGTVSDALSGVATVTCNSAAATLSGGTFSCLVTLVPGDNLITVTATDNAGNSATAASQAIFTPDSQAPVIAITSPATGTFTKESSVTVSGTASDDVAVAKVTVNDVEVPLTNGTWSAIVPLTGADGAKTITAVATDTTGKFTPASIEILLDTTPPAVVVTTPAAGATVANPSLTISGTATDAGSGLATVTCNGAAAAVASGTFSCNVALLEGSNAIALVATDKVGNQSQSSLTIQLDTRSPEVVVLAPAANVCLNGTTVQVTGRATDPHLGTVRLSITPGDASINVTPAADGTFSGSLPLGADGKYVVAVEASDTAGHTAVAAIPITADRTAPAIEITSGGAAFTGGAFNHPIIINVRAIDADPAAVVTSTLGTAPFVSGTSVAAEGQYTLNVTAHDCAGNTQRRSVTFKVDTTGPHFLSVVPATGTTITSAATAVTGTFDADDVISVVVDGRPAAGTISGRNFSISPIFAEGANNIVLVATDDAGNSTRFSYALTLKTTTPSVEILESGLPFPANALFNRNVTPVIRTNETGATVTATLDTASFSIGSEISAEGSHTIVAHASDTFGHQSDATATFTIDKTPPSLTVTEPADNATLNASTATVKGTTTGGAVKLTVNGVAITLAADGSFVTTLPLDIGPNAILVSAFDAAGNSAAVTREVVRDDNRPGLVLTTPGNGMVTNHTTITVAGQVLTPSFGKHVTINNTDVTPDATGAFRIDAFALHDGDNAITAAIAGSAQSVTVHVTSDIVPPVLHVLANGTDLQPSARFATSPAIVMQASDNNPSNLTSTLTIDGIEITGAVPLLADGGHVLVAIATDGAHNQTRIDRAFSVGSSSTAAAGCTLNGFDPPNNAAVFSNAITFSGQSGGAAAVFVNGTRATLGSGSFSVSLALNNEGANSVTVSCANADGTPTTDAPVTLTIYRYSHSPSIAITAPANNQILSSTAVAVTGTVGADVVSGDVNGIPFTPANGAFSVPNVSLATGLNIITAHARNAAGLAGIATVHVVVANGAPTITITSPIPSTQTSATTLDVSGTYTNVDRSTITAAGVAATTVPTSDTTGTFLANVPLNPGVTTIVVTGRNAAAVQVTASVDVTNAAGPSITIATPADNTFYPADATAPAAVTGSISAVDGSTVSVNGIAATLTGNQFTATIDFQNAASGTTPVLARVTTPDGASALDSIRILKMPAGLGVTSSFPEANATSVDAGALIVVLFSNPLQGNTAGGAVSLVDDAGHSITGAVFVDKDAVSFAPDVPLQAGRLYTYTVSQALKDLAGQSLAAPFVLNFTAATTAPGTAPIITDAGTQQGCLTSATIKGTASAAGARVRLSIDGLTTTTIAGFDKAFTFTVGLSGQPGFHVARIREVGTDGTASPETDVTYQINCGAPTGPTVTAAALDRGTKTLTVQFSKAMNPATLTASPTGTIQLGTLSGTVPAMNAAGDTATVTYTGDVSGALTLTVTTGAADSTGAALVASYIQSFPVDTQALGNGYITGAIYDASNGRPLQGANVVITPTANGTSTTDDHGRYSTPSLGEGAFTIEASKSGFTKVWRQVVVPAGSGVVPIDIRLTGRGAEQSSGADLTLLHGGDTAVTKAAELFVPSAALAAGHKIALTAVGGQSLAGLLPLGWSPLASAEIEVDSSSIPQAIPASRLTFVLSADDVTALAAATQTLSLVQYDNTRDEWRTVVAAAAISGGRVTNDIQTSGNYALVYPDKGTNLIAPAIPRGGAALQGVANPCGATPDVCRVSRKSFAIDPPSVPPSGRATATLITEGSDKPYPSGTAVQAYIDEQLNLADGTVSNGAPFATDLLLYRSPKADLAGAVFHVGPSSDAAKATLRDGVDHIRVVDYPGRIDRGALIGSEGGRVPGDDTISIDIPTGATSDPLHASVVPMTAADLHDFQAAGAIPGFHVAAGFSFTLTRADANTTTVDLNGDGIPDVIPVTLLKPAKGTFTIDLAKFTTANRQVVIAEVVDKSAYGTVVRLAATTVAATTPATNVKIVTTEDVNPSLLPVDGIVRDGRYLVLTADTPVAYAWGQVHIGSATGSTIPGALVTSASGSAFDAPFGVRDLTRSGGIFAIPVVAQPASALALKPRVGSIGDGDVATATAPAADAKVAFGALVLAPQPLHLTGITPDNTEVAASGFQAVATFNLAIDQSTISGGIIVTNLTTNTIVPGTVSGDGGIHVTFTPAQTLAFGSRYSIVVQPSIRSTGGAALGIAGSASFTTAAATPANSSFDRTKIQITIPANGVSTIRGTAGALPAGDVAVAIRRGQFFIQQYQTQVGSDNTTDGSFSFSIGATTGLDRVTIADQIDLQVQDKVSGSIVAVIPLTPFVTADGLGFIAPSDQTITFTAAPPLSVSVTVPVGAFDVPTIVTLAAAPKTDFAGVPSLDTELGFYGAVTLTFDGVAKKPLELNIPIPAGTDTTGKTFLLGRLGDSSRGPRIEIDDLLTVVNGKFTTAAQGTSSGQHVTRSLSVKSQNVVLGNDVRSYLLRTIESGKYSVVDIRVPAGSALGWAAMDGLQTTLDLFMNLYNSLFVSSIYLTAGHGRVVVPVATGVSFTVQGVDAATGIQLFEHRYDPIPVAPPGQVTGIPALAANTTGPYPVFGDPFSIQTVDVIGGIDSITSIPGLTIDTRQVAAAGAGQVTVSFLGTAMPDLPRHLRVYNVRSGYLSDDGSSQVNVQAQIGDRLVIYTQSDRIDARSDLSVVFNEAIALPADPANVTQAAFDAAMRPLFELWKKADPATTPPFQKVDAQTTFSVDSGNRRVTLHTDLQSGAEYFLRLNANGISDTDSPPLALMHVPGGASSNDHIDLYFAVRDPKGTFNQFNLKDVVVSDSSGNQTIYGSSLRDLALDGNLLFASAGPAGLFAYDTSDPAALADPRNAKFAFATAVGGESLSVSVDNHGRVWTTALTGMFGVVRSFRTEDFVSKLANTDPNPANAVTPFAGGTVSWRTGVTVGIDEGLSTTLLSDRPEATPRKLQIVTQDDALDFTGGASLPNPNLLNAVVGPPGASIDGEFADYTISVPTSTADVFPYLAQRITVRNVTSGFRWSKDGLAGPAGTGTPLTFAHVLIRAGDHIRIERNMRTYGVVSLFGYGIGMYDLNATESNSLITLWGSGISLGAAPPRYDKLGTLVGLTSNNDTLTYTPDAVVYGPQGNDRGTALTTIACVAAKGVAIYSQSPKTGAELNAPKTDVGANFPDPGANILSLVDTDTTLKTIAQLLHTGAAAPNGTPIFGRFNSIARYDVNKQVPQYDRTTHNVTGYNVEPHSYALVSGGRYGILVLNTDTPTRPLLVDLIWVPNGAWAVRYIGNNFATSIDGDGSTLLVDLTRLDESALTPVQCQLCSAAVFPTLAASLAAGLGADITRYGTDDPRIVWRGTPSGANTTLAAVGDSDTGFLFGGTLLQTMIRTESGVDPHVTLKMNLSGGLQSVPSVVPLGIQPSSAVAGPISAMTPCGTSGADVQQPTQCRENASQGVFRVEMSLPGSITNTIGGSINMAIESERIADGLAEQTPDPLPPAHLRQFRPASASGGTATADIRSTTFTMRRVVSDSTVNGQSNLRLQKGFNRFVSPWVIAIADPRASTQYKPSGWNPSDNHDDDGCFQCTVPPFLAPASSGKALGTDFFELYSLGRYITVRPEQSSSGVSIFGAITDPYGYLGVRHRVFARFPTVPADTVRSPKVLVAAQAPPVATGKIQETVYLHSGEVETSAVDLDAGGRAGWNVVFDRTYRSRTLGYTPYGAGWDSSIFARLRPLPTGNVEYRDGSGEVWLFLSGGNGTFTAPKGLFLNLVHTEQGWTLIDQKRRITYFDELGRIVKSTDEFFKPTGEGNVIRYTYDQNGRLSAVTDPVDRTTTITYGTTQTEEGFIKKLTDWWTTAREVDYDYWTNGSLKEAHLPQFSTQSGTSFQPTRHYDYDTGASAGDPYSDKLELATNLKNIIDPNEAPSGTPRVTFTYGNSAPRDYVATQTWGGSTGSVTFGYTQGTTPTAQTTDLLGQVRNYAFQMPASPAAGSKHLWYANDRPHIQTMTEQGVEISSTPYGTIPSTAPDPTTTPVTSSDRVTTYGYNDDGTPSTVDIAGGPHNGFGYTSAGSNLGKVTNNVTTSGAGASVSIDYTFDGDTPFLTSIKANGAVVNQTEARRDKLGTHDANSTTADSVYDDQGRATSIVSSGGNATCTADCGATTTIKYLTESASTEKHKRGLPDHVSEGANEDVKTKFTYDNEMQTTVTDARNVATVTKYDTWRRPIDVKVTMPGDTLSMEDQYDYDASGHLHEHRRMQDGDVVKTTYEYDPIGRTKSVTTDHVATDGTPTVETYDYAQFPTGTIKHFTDGATIGGGAETDITLDHLGRTKRTETKVVGPGTTNIVTVSAYDIAGNPAYTSDTQKFATAMAYDASGRRTDVKHTDGSVEHFDYDGFGHVTTSTRKAKDGTVVYSRSTPYTADGQLPSATEVGGTTDAGSRTTSRAWDGGGRTAGVAVTASGEPTPRAAVQQYDTAGRIQSSKSGTGTQTILDSTFSEANWTGYGGNLASTVSTTEEKVPASGLPQTYQSTSGFDTAGNAKSVSVGDLSWSAQFDEAGNVKTAQEPGDRGQSSMKHNAAGAVTTETLADGVSSQSHDYDNTGSGKAFHDPGTTPEITSVTSDNLGRPLIITYQADGTTQEIHYDGARVLAVKDRQDRWQSFVYEGGHLTQIWDRVTPGTGNQLDKIDYDGAGRVQHWTTPDTKIDYAGFTLDGLPLSTTQTRYRNHTGLSTQDILDTFNQTHGYNGHGERTSYSVPGGAPAGTWATSVTVHYDAMGNVDTLTTDGGLSLTGDYRAAGRPNSRTIMLPVTGGAPKSLARTYTYQQDTGQLHEMKATIGSADVAGSTVAYDGLLVKDATLIGVSNGLRHTRHTYDRRGRLGGSVVAASADAQAPPPGGAASSPGSTVETPDPADFRTGQSRAPLLDPTVASLLQSRGIDTAAIDPPSVTATPFPGHKIQTFSRGTSTRTFNFDGKSELVDDGLFLYDYDAKGRLDWAAEKATATGVVIRRILYTYDGNNRLVGRTAQAATVTSLTASYNTFTWNLEIRPEIIAIDGIPAETTFVWDPVSDRIIAVVRAGDSKLASDPNNNVLKQIIHGDMGYDDPLEVTTVDTSALVAPGQAQPVTKLYPIYDEAAGGTLQVVVNRNGEVVARSVNNDPFGGAEFDLAGAAIDHVEVQATKNAQGGLDSVVVTMRATEQLTAASVASGARLAVVDVSGNLVRTSSTPATLATNDAYTVKWTLSASDWATLSDPTAVNNHTPASLSIAATSTLRAALWKVDLPILPAPDWVTASEPVFTSSALPVEVRESLAALSTTISALNAGGSKTTVSYDAPNLGLLGTSGGNAEVETMLAATFQAQPFAEPFTHKIYVRERWYDPTTGTWLTPDPLGYQDSSNLYAFAGGDPVNGRDPTGLYDGSDLREDFRAPSRNRDYQRKVARMKFCEDHPQDQGCHAEAVRDRAGWRFAGAVGQVTAGIAAISSTGPIPEPVTKTLGWTALVRGVENGATAIKELWTGEEQDTPGGRVVNSIARRVGATPAQAAKTQQVVEGTVDAVSTFGSSAAAAYNASRLGALGQLVDVNVDDEAADALAERIGGRSRVKFSNGPANEFDAVSDKYVAQTKPANFKMGKAFRNQAKATFEAAAKTGRQPYFHFNGPPAPDVLAKLREYAARYGVEPVIDTSVY
ncbi:MAG TPA: Ig-like domain-containing protein [Thermoanaerobaculia bacterium]|nr:Ig-like domain-containing protein [Thermoanaerobaculia bacterium]